MIVHSIHALDNKLYIFTTREKKDGKDLKGVLYCMILNEDLTIIQRFKQVIEFNTKYTALQSRITVLPEKTTKQIMVILQADLTNPKQNVKIGYMLFDIKMEVVKTAQADLAIVSRYKEYSYFVGVDYTYTGDGYLYASAILELELTLQNRHDRDPIKAFSITDLESKKSYTAAIEFPKKKVLDLGIVFTEGEELFFTGFYSDAVNAKSTAPPNGIFRTTVNKRTGAVVRSRFSQFTPKQITELADANTLDKQKAKEKNVKNEEVSSKLTVTDIRIHADSTLSLVTEYKYDFLETFYNSYRGSVCVFNLSAAGEVKSILSVKRYEEVFGNMSCWYLDRLFVFTDKKNPENLNVLYFTEKEYDVDPRGKKVGKNGKKAAHIAEINIKTNVIKNARLEEELKETPYAMFKDLDPGRIHLLGGEVYLTKIRKKWSVRNYIFASLLFVPTVGLSPFMISVVDKTKREFYTIGKLSY
jgi:hypothetical protein